MTAIPSAGAELRDDRLRLARRIDWRFLGPSPELGRIGVAGAPDATLLAALDAVDPRGAAERLDRAGGARPDGPGTAVVVGGVAREVLAAAAASVGPDGRLIVELGGPLTGLLVGGRTTSPGAAVRIARALAAGGFAVRTWIAWPTQERAAAWAALDDPPAMRSLVDRRLGGLAGRAAGSLAASLAGRGAGGRLLALGAPAITIVAVRLGREPSVDRPWLTALLAADEHAAPGPGLLMLSPRYRASAHVVGLGLDAAARAPVRVAKVARLPDDTGLAHETTVLQALAAASPASSSGRFPRVVEAAGGGTWPHLVETGVAGSPLDPPAVRADRDGAVRAVIDWLATLPVEPSGKRSTAVRDRLTSALSTVRAVAPSRIDLRQLAERTERVVAPLAEVALPRVFEHGDPAHPNLIRSADGRVGAVDWERGDPDGLPLHDLTIALAYLAAAEREARDPAAQAMAFAAALTAPGAWAAEALDGEARRLGIDPAVRPALVVCAWLRSTAWLADRLLGRGEFDEPVSADGSLQGVADWLGGDRSVALWRVSLDAAETARRSG